MISAQLLDRWLMKDPEAEPADKTLWVLAFMQRVQETLVVSVAKFWDHFLASNKTLPRSVIAVLTPALH